MPQNCVLEKHRSYGSIIHPLSLQRRFAQHTKTTRPAGTSYRHTAIIPLKIPIIPPWVVIRRLCDNHLCALPKACTFPDTYRRLFSEILSHYPGCTVLFTDGSLINWSTGCTFILNAQAFKLRINPFSSIFSAELFALWKAHEAVS
jgi:hypothetical protein